MNKINNLFEQKEIIRKLNPNIKVIAFQWFNQCVKEFLDDSYEKHYRESEINTKFEREGKQAVTAYQLLSISAFLEQYPYIESTKGSIFIDLLHNEICKDELLDIYKYLKRYHEVTLDPQTLITRFSHDLVKYITRKNDSDLMVIADSMRVRHLVIPLYYLTQSVTAKCFDDEKLADELFEKLKKI